jgi:hypothetical protein
MDVNVTQVVTSNRGPFYRFSEGVSEHEFVVDWVRGYRLLE